MPKYSVPVWQMIVSTFEKNGPQKYASVKNIVTRVHSSYPKENVNRMTIRLQTIFHCVNHPGRKNDVSKRWERNPLFYTDGKNGFRLLSKIEVSKYKIK